jgi:hypothetical protein
MAGLRVGPGEQAKLSFNDKLSLFHAMVAHAIKQPEIVRLYAVLQAEALDEIHPAHDYFVQRESWIMDQFAKIVMGDVDDPPSTARLLVAMINGLEQQWLRANQSFDLLAAWDRAIASLLRHTANVGGVDTIDRAQSNQTKSPKKVRVRAPRPSERPARRTDGV